MDGSHEKEPVRRLSEWGSIYDILVHILWGDCQWTSRFDDWPPPETL